jgi:Rieske 2Fe-2S family protein
MPVTLPENPVQRLPREAYVSQGWFDREQTELFGKTWAFAGVTMDYKDTGDFRTIQCGPHSLIVIKGADGTLRGFHNICRHRGTELVEGCGNAGRSIMCPYHNWVYNLDGSLRGVPAHRECFADLDKKTVALHGAAVGVFQNLVFVHPEANPDIPFGIWVDNLASVPWPHDLGSADLQESSETLVYEMKCNWKVFAENALDGYHLAYLHKNTLGGPTHDKNLWEIFGEHMVWWSTEREGVKHRIPEFVEKAAKGSGTKTVKGADVPGYGGVYLLFPTTILTPNPWGFSISTLDPLDPETTLFHVRNWAPKGWLSYDYRAKDVPGFDAESGRIKSSKWTKHPLETEDFQTEDIWVCEKMQRALHSPLHSVDYLAKGAGGEAAIDAFQQIVLSYMQTPAR